MLSAVLATRGSHDAQSPSRVLPVVNDLEPSDIPVVCERLDNMARVGDGTDVLCDLSAVTRPDAVTVDALARPHLTAHQHGYPIRFRGVSRQLEALISLVGLSDVLDLRNQNNQASTSRSDQQ